MYKIKNKVFPKYISIGIIVFILIMSYFIIKPFFGTLFISIILTYLAYPLYHFFWRKTKAKHFSAGITIFLIILIILIPVGYLFSVLFNEVADYYTTFSSHRDLLIHYGDCKINPTSCELMPKLSLILQDPTVRSIIVNSVDKILSFFVNLTSSLIITVPALIINLIIIIVSMFYFLMEAPNLVVGLEELLPMQKKLKNHLVDVFDKMVRAVFWGFLIVIILQGLAAMFAYWIIGVKSPVFWGVLTIFAAAVPIIGAALIWFPISVTFILNGMIVSDSLMIYKGIGLLVFGLFVIGLLDNLFKIYYLGNITQIHPLIVLIGVFGGVYAFGFAGIFAGPLVLVLLVGIIKIFRNESSLLK